MNYLELKQLVFLLKDDELELLELQIRREIKFRLKDATRWKPQTQT